MWDDIYSFCVFFGFEIAIFIYSGKVIVHALDENARAYYNLETLWTTKPSEKEPIQVKLRLTN